MKYVAIIKCFKISCRKSEILEKEKGNGESKCMHKY